MTRDRRAVRRLAAGGDEASRRAGARRTDRARQDRAHRALPSQGGADGNRHAVAGALRALLDRTSWMRWQNSWRRSQCSKPKPKPHPQAPASKRPPAQVFCRLDGPGKNNPLVRAGRDGRRLGAGGHGRARRAGAIASASRPRTANTTRSAASIARSCPTSGWSSAGPGTRRRSASRWSRSR